MVEERFPKWVAASKGRWGSRTSKACWVSGQGGQQWPAVGEPTHAHTELCSAQLRLKRQLKRQPQPVCCYWLSFASEAPQSLFSCVIYQSLCILSENQTQRLNPSVVQQIGLQLSLHFSKGNRKTPQAAWQFPVFCSVQPCGLGLCPELCLYPCLVQQVKGERKVGQESNPRLAWLGRKAL